MSSSAPQLAVLTIAGTDPSGGAGIQADLKTFAAHGCYGTSVVTALVAQNTTGVQAIHPSPPEFVKQQIASVLDDIEIKAIKTGMLFDADNTRAVVQALKSHYSTSPSPPLVCDPVCVSTSGHSLLQDDAVEVLIEELFPIATLITPNKSEAELLLKHRQLPDKIDSLEDMLRASLDLLSLGPKAVLLKGGHITATLEDVKRLSSAHSGIPIIRHGLFEDNMEILQANAADLSSRTLVVDILRERDGTAALFVRPRVDSTSTHGTGCTLSAALACEFARGSNFIDATRAATVYTHLGIETAHPIGKGHGPLNHLHSLCITSIPRPTPSDPFPFTRLLIKDDFKTWKAYVEHDFVRLLGQGTLPRESFVHFIKQDYHYLKYYARAYALLAAKSPSFSAIEVATRTIVNVLNEIGTHRSFCAQFGVTSEDLENTEESPATTAYGAYLIDTGFRGDETKLLMALLACLLGYGEVGLWLKKEAAQKDSWVQLDDNPYLQWINDYSGEHYQGAVKLGLEVIEARAVADPPSPARYDEWCAVWRRCTKLEKGFWDMAMQLS